MVITASADIDAAVRDLVRSAFSHAGQKCSAASLALVQRCVLDHPAFLRQLADATVSLNVGWATDPAADIGPLIRAPSETLQRALSALDPGESWLVEPVPLEPSRRLWRPGIRLGVKPGSWAHRHEWFGPVLALVAVDNLDEAIAAQNGTGYGLTAGLHSLDPAEHSRWAAGVEAGNLYINRATTGAVVGRQPFGGWARSSVGPTAKAGGPDYLLTLASYTDPDGDRAGGGDYTQSWAALAGPTDAAALRSETNCHRRIPLRRVSLRLGEAVAADQVAHAVAAADTVGAQLSVTSATPQPAGLGLGLGGRYAVIDDDTFVASLTAAPGPQRVRFLGGAAQEQARVVHACLDAGITVNTDPVSICGRIELPRWCREQTVTTTTHRYGNITPPALEHAGPASATPPPPPRPAHANRMATGPGADMRRPAG